MGKFFDELKRRNVVRVGIVYIVVCWLVFQIGEILFEAFGAPDWVFKTVILLLAIGLPFALLFAWAFEMTPDGVKKTRDVHVTASITASTGRKLDFVIIAALVVALGYFVWERQSPTGAIAPASQSVAESSDRDTVDEETPRRSIAVIPFVNMSSDEEQEWFADGLTEEILNSLARTPDLLVAARTSSFTFKGSNETIQTIAAALGVDHILEGSVRRAGERLRVTAQLVRANDGFHLWSETYDRNVDDMIDIQENVAIEIANAMDTAMDPDALAKMVSSGTSSVPAFEAYLQGLAVGESTFASQDIYEYLNARDAFERAIETDPEFAQAYWQLAEFWQVQMNTTSIVSGITELSPDEMLPKYKDAISKAIEFEKDPVSKIMYRSHRARTEMKFHQAHRLINEYLERRPNDQWAQVIQIQLLAELNMRDELHKVVADFDGRDGYDMWVMASTVQQLMYGGDNDALKEFVDKAMERMGDNPDIVYQAHRAMLWLGDIDGASKVVPIIQASYMPEDSRYLVALRQACAENRIADAERLFLKAPDKLKYNPSIDWLSHLILGDDEGAINALRKYDAKQDMTTMTSFLTYGTFDPSPYPNLMAVLEAEGIGRKQIVKLPYQCKR